MSLIQNSFGASRYRVLAKAHKVTLGELDGLISRYKATSLGLESPKKKNAFKELKLGWVCPPHVGVLEGEDTLWTMGDLRIAEGFLLRMRVEKRSVPSKLLNQVWKEAVYKEEQDKGHGLSRAEKKALKEDLKHMLMERVLPDIRYVEAMWWDRAEVLVVLSSSPNLCDLFMKLFQQTFATPLNLTVIPVEAPLMAVTPDEWDDLPQGTVPGTLLHIRDLVPEMHGA